MRGCGCIPLCPWAAPKGENEALGAPAPMPSLSFSVRERGTWAGHCPDPFEEAPMPLPLPLSSPGDIMIVIMCPLVTIHMPSCDLLNVVFAR